MKKAYLFAFSNTLGTQKELENTLNSIPEVITWRYDMPNAFYVISNADAGVLSDAIRERTKNTNGRFIITEIPENRQGWLTNESWHLIRNKEHKPKAEKA
jgi:hypothetical protein